MKIVETNGYLKHVCPGCDQEHLIPMWGKNPWQFNNIFESPTLSPSVKQTMRGSVGGVKFEGEKICHYFIREGNIEYCTDSHHEMKGKTIPLPEVNG